ARRRLAGRRHRVLEIDAHDVRARGQRLLEALRPRARHEEQAADRLERDRASSAATLLAPARSGNRRPGADAFARSARVPEGSARLRAAAVDPGRARSSPSRGPQPKERRPMSERFQRITPCLWFDGRAEEAVAHYTAIFERSRVGRVTRYGRDAAQVSGMPEGAVLTIDFELDGQAFTALNGGPQFRFTEALSLIVHCRDQAEVDHYWRRLS